MAEFASMHRLVAQVCTLPWQQNAKGMIYVEIHGRAKKKEEQN